VCKISNTMCRLYCLVTRFNITSCDNDKFGFVEINLFHINELYVVLRGFEPQVLALGTSADSVQLSTSRPLV